MHPDQLDVDEDRARELIADQFPMFATQPIRRLSAPGTVNAIFRVGDRAAARFPWNAATEDELEAESTAMAELAARCPVPAPQPLGIGAPSPIYPSAWAVQTWLDGETATPEDDADSESLAEDVAALIRSLRGTDPAGRTFDGKGRGGDLRNHDEWMSECFSRSAHLLDTDRAMRLWESLHDLPTSGRDVMSHRDLTPPNLLVAGPRESRRLVGVLDGGGFGPADPALDLVAAWHLFDAPSRRTVRTGTGATDVEWFRGAAWALQQAMGLGWYYETSNPEMSALGLSTMRRLLDDEELAESVG